MKRFIILLIIILGLLANISCKKTTNNESGNTGENSRVSLELQKEMILILENNTGNPDNALMLLDKYYEKHAEKLKKQLGQAINRRQMPEEYTENMTQEEKDLFKRQTAALDKILVLEPEFNMKLMEIMKKYGLAVVQ
jgi:hypothetical protein